MTPDPLAFIQTNVCVAYSCMTLWQCPTNFFPIHRKILYETLIRTAASSDISVLSNAHKACQPNKQNGENQSAFFMQLYAPPTCYT